MTCQELADFIIDYVEEKLPEGQRATFEDHLAVCPSCIEYLKVTGPPRRCWTTSAAKRRKDVPCEVPTDLVNAILAARKVAE